MPHIDILVLAIIRGVTEYLPVAASGHLLLLAKTFCWPLANPVTALAGEIGLLLALALYFWREVIGLGQGLLQVLKRKRDPRSRLLGYLLLGAIPATIINIALQILLEDSLASAWLIAIMLIVFGLLLYLADRLGLTVRRIEHLNIGSALAIGLMQCLDVMPGVSRFGIAFTTSRLLGFERLEAARFALLLGLPSGVIFILYQLYLSVAAQMGAHAAPIDPAGAALALVATFIAGFLALSFLMYWLRRASVAPFVIYRVALGLYLLYQLYRGAGFTC
ncbi:MAG TPA: undecaprenyl-diphosphate phosphatase [Terriglobia bacterium]|nr:undecaprenyl-diphosphate phosphatase [Terriglobia bacterium]